MALKELTVLSEKKNKKKQKKKKTNKQKKKTLIGLMYLKFCLFMIHVIVYTVYGILKDRPRFYVFRFLFLIVIMLQYITCNPGVVTPIMLALVQYVAVN